MAKAKVWQVWRCLVAPHAGNVPAACLELAREILDA